MLCNENFPLKYKFNMMIWCCVNVGKRAFIAGVADDQGYGWAIAKALAAAGADILVGTWVPVCVSSFIRT